MRSRERERGGGAAAVDGTGPEGSVPRTLLLWLVAVGLLVLRVPRLLVEPRFFREEAQVYFRHAFGLDALDALFRPHFDYLALVPNAATVAARHLFPLEAAPLLTTVVGLLVQLVPVALIVHGRARLWSRPSARAAGVLIVLLTGSGNGLWATALAAQYHLSVAALLVLVEPAPGRARPLRCAAHLGVLALSGLTGLLSLMLIPVFALVAWRERSRARWGQVAVLVLCLAAQVALVASVLAEIEGPRSPLISRFRLTDPEMLGWIGVCQLLVPAFGGNGAGAAAAEWFWETRQSALASAAGLAGVSALALLVLLFARRTPAGLAIAGALVVSFVLNTLGALPPPRLLLIPGLSSVRYFLLPVVAFGLLALARWTAAPRGAGRVALVVVAVTLANGAWSYAHPTDLHFDGPSWEEEVARWRRGETKVVRVWPDESWSFELAVPDRGVEPERRVLGPATSAAGEPRVSLEVSTVLFGARGRILIEGPAGAPLAVFFHRGDPVEPWLLEGCTMHVPPAAPAALVTIPVSGLVTGGIPAPQASAVGEPLVIQAVLWHDGRLHASEAWRVVPGS